MPDALAELVETRMVVLVMLVLLKTFVSHLGPWEPPEMLVVAIVDVHLSR